MKRLLLAFSLLLLSTAAFAGAQSVTVSQAGISAPIGLNLVAWNPVSLLVTFSDNASLTCTVQVSNDGFNVRDSRGNPLPATHWNNHDTLVNLTPGGTTNPNGNIYFPVVQVRLIASNWVSGSCTLAIAQVGP